MRTINSFNTLSCCLLRSNQMVHQRQSQHSILNILVGLLLGYVGETPLSINLSSLKLSHNSLFLFKLFIFQTLLIIITVVLKNNITHTVFITEWLWLLAWMPIVSTMMHYGCVKYSIIRVNNGGSFWLVWLCSLFLKFQKSDNYWQIYIGFLGNCT